MLVVYTDRLLNRLGQLLTEIQTACNTGFDFYDRLREFKRFCDGTSAFAHIIGLLPPAKYDFEVDWRDIRNVWPAGEASYAMRWDAIKQMVNGGTAMVDKAWSHFALHDLQQGMNAVVNTFVIPIHDFLVDRLVLSSATLYALLRYKRWAEWFEADRLRARYEANAGSEESILDESVRRFLFESGIDYPFSQPASPRGKVDIVAGLETDDPLVLEVKVWDSSKGYKKNRVRDGLRQVMTYAAQYGKDSGQVVVFNLDQQPLSFISLINRDEWPPRIEHGGRTYYFIDVNIAEKLKPISQQDIGKPVKVNEVDLASLLTDTSDSVQ